MRRRPGAGSPAAWSPGAWSPGSWRPGAWRWRRPVDQRGSLSVEVVIIVPGLVLMLGLMVAGGRLWQARTDVAAAAYSAARAASLARSAGIAAEDGRQAGLDQLGDRGLRCRDQSVQVDTSAFAVPVGQPATVTSVLSCRVDLSDVVLPGLPGSILVQARGRSALDTYRQR